MDTEQEIRKAIKFFGSQRKMAAALGVTQPLIIYWLKNSYVPARHARKLHELAGLDKSKLCPDVY